MLPLLTCAFLEKENHNFLFRKNSGLICVQSCKRILTLFVYEV